MLAGGREVKMEILESRETTPVEDQLTRGSGQR